MSFRNSRPQSRRNRRQSGGPVQVDSTKVELPGPLRLMTNRTVLIVLGTVMAAGLLIGLLPGLIGLNSGIHSGGGGGSGGPQQANELPDAPGHEAIADAPASTPEGETPPPAATPAQTVKRFDTAPALTIDPTKRYVATIETDQGAIELELFADEAPETVNSFVFLASEGYYDANPVILGVNSDGSPFAAALGDPTGTGNLRPGYTTPREANSLPFVTGAVGMGDSQTSENDGRFWISFADAPSLNGKYTIFGQVVTGIDLLETLAQGGARIVSVTVTES